MIVKLWHTKAKELTQGQTGTKWQSQVCEWPRARGLNYMHFTSQSFVKFYFIEV